MVSPIRRIVIYRLPVVTRAADRRMTGRRAGGKPGSIAARLPECISPGGRQIGGSADGGACGPTVSLAPCQPGFPSIFHPIVAR